jgi:hypothetical protein
MPRRIPRSSPRSRPLLPLASSLAASAALACLVTVPASGAVAPPGCATGAGHAFPVTARISGGPEEYEAGAAPATWYLDLANTTSRTCAGIHPVVVLVDGKQVLTAAQPHLEFSDGTRTHAVTFQQTDHHELVGVFADDAAGFPGFTVGPGRSVRVRVSLGLAADAVDNEVVAGASVVQRYEDDGAWVGQSGDYRFRVAAAGGEDAEEDQDAEEDGDGSTTGDPGGELARTGGRADAAARLAAAGSAACLLLGTGALLLARRVRMANNRR